VGLTGAGGERDGSSGAGASAADRCTPEQRTRDSSAYAFAVEVVARLAEEGVEAEAEVSPVWVDGSGAGSYYVSVVEGGTAAVLCEVADHLPGVRLLDPYGEDVSRDDALAYVVRRELGASPRDAAAAVWPPAPRRGARTLGRRGADRLG
jgi:hypothetical protein